MMLRVPSILLGFLIAVWNTSASPLSTEVKGPGSLQQPNHENLWDVLQSQVRSRDSSEQTQFGQRRSKRGYHVPGCEHGFGAEFPHQFPPVGGWNPSFTFFKPDRKPFGSEGGNQGFYPFGFPSFGNIPGSGWNWPRPGIGGSNGFNPFGRPGFGNGNQNPRKDPTEQNPGLDNTYPGSVDPTGSDTPNGNPSTESSNNGNDRGSNNDNTGSGTDNPGSANADPGSTTADPGSSNDNPTTGDEDPSTGNENSASGDNNQGSDGDNGLEGGSQNQPNPEGSNNQQGSSGNRNSVSTGNQTPGGSKNTNLGTAASDESRPGNEGDQPEFNGEGVIQIRGRPWTTQRPLQNVLFNENTIPEAPCIRRCPSVNNYDPVCGTDNITYQNRAKFTCAKQCGREVSEAYAGSCFTTQSPISI